MKKKMTIERQKKRHQDAGCEFVYLYVQTKKNTYFLKETL